MVQKYGSVDKVPEKNKNSKGEVVVEQTKEEMSEVKSNLSETVGQAVAVAMIKATIALNFIRELYNIPPVRIDPITALLA